MAGRMHVAPGYFAIALLPLGVFFLNDAILQAFASTDPAVPADLVTGPAWVEAAGRLRYLGAYWLFSAMALLAFALCVQEVLRPVTRSTRIGAGLTLGFILAIVFGITVENFARPDIWRIWHLLDRDVVATSLAAGTLPACMRPGNEFLLGRCGDTPILVLFDRSLSVMNLIAALGVGSVVVGMILCLGRSADGKDTPEVLSFALSCMRRQLYVAGLLLVSGMLFVISWVQWPVSMIAPEARDEYRGLATALELFTGIHFSLLILSFYVPVALILTARVHRLARTATPRATAEERDKWRTTHGLAVSATDMLRAGFAVAAPALTALAGGLAPVGH